MKLLNNPEIRKFVIVISLPVLSASIVFLWINRVCSAVLLAAYLIFISFFLRFESKRYARIRSLSDEIDAVLNQNKDFIISDMHEGDLSLLQNEIAKTTQQLKAQADHLSKDKEFMSRTMADISHQLRTPLTSIRLNLSLLKDPSLTTEKQKDLLREISSSVTRMERLVEELLKLSRLDAGAAIMKKENVSVQSIVDRAVSALSIPLDIKNVHVKSDCRDARFCIDIYWTNEAFVNIIKNCMEHVKESGTIQISAEETPLFTKIMIQDNGEGFSEDDLPHIFERFYKGKNASPSSIGIGLALAETVIHEQNGTIKASNNPDGGACFTIQFYKQII